MDLALRVQRVRRGQFHQEIQEEEAVPLFSFRLRIVSCLERVRRFLISCSTSATGCGRGTRDAGRYSPEAKGMFRGIGWPASEEADANGGAHTVSKNESEILKITREA